VFPILRVVSLAALFFGGIGTLHAAHPISGFEDCPLVADSELDQMRGGFETSSGGLPLSFSFGIERTTYQYDQNGQLVYTTTIDMPNLTSALNAQGAQNWPASVMTMIQNSKDNQTIGVVTTINASITSRDFLRSLAAQSSLNQMNFRSVH